MALDINTPRGQQTLIDETKAVAIFESHHPRCLYANTPKKEAGDVDAVVVHLDEGDVKCVVETKCRYDVTLAQFHDEYSGKWLVTFDKILKGMKLAEALRVPLYGFLYIVKDKALLMRRLWSPAKGLEAHMEIRKTKTQATVNGGEAVRDNAFLDMTGTVPLYLKEERDVPLLDADVLGGLSARHEASE
jgi:hypothetical protein